MNLPKIVCPYNKSLLKSLTGCELAVRVNSPDQAEKAAADVRGSGNRLFCVIMETDSAFANLELGENLKKIPLAIMAPAGGKFRLLARRLKSLREFNLRVYLPCDNSKNLAGLRILSSAGIHTCALFGKGKTDWEALTDLMTYAVLERTPHSPIEPFAFIADHYDSFSYLNWGGILFDDPERFLHLDARGRVALSAEELSKKTFIARNISEIAAAEEFPAIRQRSEEWRRYFLENHPCASCRGWKVCLGKFSARGSEKKACESFFLELIEVARQRRARKDKDKAEERPIWQP